MIPFASGPLSVQIAARNAVNVPVPTVLSWDDLYEVKTVGMWIPWVIIWIDQESGERRVTRLLESDAETNREAGIQRPRDYDVQAPRVWFLAG